MKKQIAILFACTGLLAAAAGRTFTGVVTDTMCGSDHKARNVQPDAKCVRDCVKAGSQFKYALVSGKDVYVLSDQKSADKFAAQRVKVTGSLNGKTIQVESIAPAK